MTETEAKVAAVYCSVLEVGRAEPDDDIFVLGGDSLHIIRIALELERFCGVEITPEFLGANNKISDLAQWLDSQRAGAAPRRAEARV